jgi:hypothetical protein
MQLQYNSPEKTFYFTPANKLREKGANAYPEVRVRRRILDAPVL